MTLTLVSAGFLVSLMSLVGGILVMQVWMPRDSIFHRFVFCLIPMGQGVSVISLVFGDDPSLGSVITGLGLACVSVIMVARRTSKLKRKTDFIDGGVTGNG